MYTSYIYIYIHIHTYTYVINKLLLYASGINIINILLNIYASGISKY